MNNELNVTIEKMLQLMGFNDCRLIQEADNRRVAIFINNGEYLMDKLPELVNHIDYIARLVARKNNFLPMLVDINNYRKDREGIILELAKAAARRATLSKESVDLPAMNAYERRLIHVELATRPDVKTESVGEGTDRHVVVRPI